MSLHYKIPLETWQAKGQIQKIQKEGAEEIVARVQAQAQAQFGDSALQQFRERLWAKVKASEDRF